MQQDEGTSGLEWKPGPAICVPASVPGPLPGTGFSLGWQPDAPGSLLSSGGPLQCDVEAEATLEFPPAQLSHRPHCCVFCSLSRVPSLIPLGYPAQRGTAEAALGVGRGFT